MNFIQMFRIFNKHKNLISKMKSDFFEIRYVIFITQVNLN